MLENPNSALPDIIVSTSTKQFFVELMPDIDWGFLNDVADEELGSKLVVLGENVDENITQGIANLGVPKEVIDMFNLRQAGMSEWNEDEYTKDQLISDALSISMLTAYFFSFESILPDDQREDEERFNEELRKLFIWPQLMQDENSDSDDGLYNHGYRATLSTADIYWKSSGTFVKQLDLDITLSHYSLLYHEVVKHITSIGAKIKVSYGLSDKHEIEKWNELTSPLQFKNEYYQVRNYTLAEDSDGTVKLKISLFPTITSQTETIKFWNFLTLNDYYSIISQDFPGGFWELFNISSQTYNRPLSRFFLLLYLTGLYNKWQNSDDNKTNKIAYSIDKQFLADLIKRNKSSAVQKKKANIRTPVTGTSYSVGSLTQDFKDDVNKTIKEKHLNPNGLNNLLENNGALYFAFIQSDALDFIIDFAKNPFQEVKQFPNIKWALRSAQTGTNVQRLGAEITLFDSKNNFTQGKNIDFVANFIKIAKNKHIFDSTIDLTKLKITSNSKKLDVSRTFFEFFDMFNFKERGLDNLVGWLLIISANIIGSGILEDAGARIKDFVEKNLGNLQGIAKQMMEITEYQNGSTQNLINEYDSQYKVSDNWIKQMADVALSYNPMAWIDESCRAICEMLRTVDIEPSNITVPTMQPEKPSVPKYYFKSGPSNESSPYNHIYFFTKNTYDNAIMNSVSNGRPSETIKFRVGADGNVIDNILISAGLNINTLYEVGNGINIRGLGLKNSILKYLFDRARNPEGTLLDNAFSECSKEDFESYMSGPEGGNLNDPEKRRKVWETIQNSPIIYDKLYAEIRSQYLKNPTNMVMTDITLDSSEEQWINNIDFDAQISAWLGDILMYEANINIWGLPKLTPFMSFEIEQTDIPVDDTEDPQPTIVYAGTYLITELSEKFSQNGYVTSIKGIKVIF